VLALQMQRAAEIRCALQGARIAPVLGALKAMRDQVGGQRIVQRTKVADELATLLKKLVIPIPKRLLTVTEAPEAPVSA
jgi:hypothetical protein